MCASVTSEVGLAHIASFLIRSFSWKVLLAVLLLHTCLLRYTSVGFQEGGRWTRVIAACDIFNHGCFSKEMFNEGREDSQLFKNIDTF